MLAGGKQNIHFPLRRFRIDLVSLLYKIIRGIPLRGNHYYNIVAFFVFAGDNIGYIKYTFGIGDGTSSKFLND